MIADAIPKLLKIKLIWPIVLCYALISGGNHAAGNGEGRMSDSTQVAELKKALRGLRDAILSMSRHGYFDHSIDSEQLWRPAISRAYELVGLPDGQPLAGGCAQETAFSKTPSAADVGAQRAIAILDSLAAGVGDYDPWVVNGFAFGQIAGTVDWLKNALGPEFVSEKLYAIADLMAGAAADARVKAS